MKLKEMKLKSCLIQAIQLLREFLIIILMPGKYFHEIGDFIRSLGPLLPENEYRNDRH